VRELGRLGLELMIFAAATAAFVGVGKTVIGGVFAVLAVGTALPFRNGVRHLQGV